MIESIQAELVLAEFSDLGETPPVATVELTVADRAELGRYEAVIERGLETFLDVGRAMLAIRDGKLYRGDYGSFEMYCRARWGMSKSRAYQMIDAANVLGNLETSTIVDVLPANESQVRPLTKLEPAQQVEAWAVATEDAGGGIPTAAQVEKAAAKFTEPKPTKPRAEVKRVAEPYAAPTPTPAKAVYVEPKPELAIEWVRIESNRLSIQGFKMQKVNGRFRYVWERQDQPKVEYSETFAFLADAYDAAFARLKECGLDDRFPPEPAAHAPTPDELEAVAIVAAEQAEEDAERAARAATRPSFENVPEPIVEPEPKPASMLTHEWVVFVLVNYTPSNVDFGVALKSATLDDLREAMAGFDQEEKHWRVRLDALNRRFDELMAPDPRIADAKNLIAILAQARAAAKADYGRLCGLHLDLVTYERVVESMTGRLQSLVANLELGKDVTK